MNAVRARASHQRRQRTCELARACDGGALSPESGPDSSASHTAADVRKDPTDLGQLNLRELADLAWARYQHWLQRLARPRGAQLDLLELSDASSQAREWRGIWCAIEREIHARSEGARA